MAQKVQIKASSNAGMTTKSWNRYCCKHVNFELILQKDDRAPVFIKKGFSDKVLYNVTVGLTLLNLFWSVKVLCALENTGKN